jgi:hypothetical protein
MVSSEHDRLLEPQLLLALETGDIRNQIGYDDETDRDTARE